MLVLEGFDPVEDDKLDVVVGLFDDQVDKGTSSSFDSGRVLSEDGKSGGCLVFDHIGGTVQKFKDGADISGLHTSGFVNSGHCKMDTISLAHPRLTFGLDALFANKLYDSQLHELILRSHRVVQVVHEVVKCADGCGVNEHSECVSLACRVAFGNKEGLHEFRRVWNEMFVLLVDLHDCEYRVLADERVAMFLEKHDGMRCQEGE